jgi:hypothetical protein
MKRLTLAALISLAASVAIAQEKSGAEASMQSAGSAHKAHGAAPAGAEPKLECAPTATPVFAKDGRLWVAFSVGDAVYATFSKDMGKSFAPPFTVAKIEGATIDDNSEARPKLVSLDDGTLVASFTTRPAKSYNGTIFVARSTDGGRSFSKPQPLVDGVGQRFEIFALSPKGRLYVAWLDKRNAEKAKTEGRAFEGSGAAVAWSDDGGVSGRVGEDEWATTCPHHGPSLAIDSDGQWHVAWFAHGKKRQGLFYVFSRDG